MARRDLSGAVDFDYLLSYAAQDLCLVEEVLGLFCEQVELWMRLMDPEGDAGAFRDGAHTLKGAALGIGARGLAEACAAAEADALAGSGLRQVRLEAVAAALGAVTGDIAAWCHEQALQSLKGPGSRG